MKYFLLYFVLITCISSGYSQKHKTISGPVFQEFGYVFPIEDADLLLDKDKKYKVIFDVYSDEKKSSQMNPLINTVARFMNMHAQNGVKEDNMDIVLVLHGVATKNALNEAVFKKEFKNEHPNYKLLAALAAKKVKIYVCAQSLQSKGYDASDISEHVGISLSALTALVKYQSEGYQIINFN
ncbi:DsrE family protein [Lutimonas halocynthiae]|uniref:DsrE family protein n=1 Tax=Lutimonas halocynthiae TaxID=1446477 RepID=UPI0025B49818|nr:DsrE family protein [Lutimonas halocynthiae]MDN3643810.1 DsrE family protein [Lutimonas halocynthiae]